MAAKRSYDLVVLIDPDLPEERRAQIVQDLKRQIDSQEGGLKADADWGTRKMAYEINHRSEAQYHLFQLEATADLLGQLDHTLKIDDGVLRHRIIEGAAPIEDRPPPPPPRPGSGRPEGGVEQPEGEASQTEGEAPQTEDEAPQPEGEAPQPEDGAPAETAGPSPEAAEAEAPAAPRE